MSQDLYYVNTLILLKNLNMSVQFTAQLGVFEHQHQEYRNHKRETLG